MQYKVLLEKNANLKQVESEEKAKFIKLILETLEIDSSFWDVNSELDVNGRIQLRNLLKKYDISIVEQNDGELFIYHERNRIGEWRRPTYVLKEDLTQLDPKNRLYLEMTVNPTSVFENT